MRLVSSCTLTLVKLIWLARPPRPVADMSDDEIRSWSAAVLDRLWTDLAAQETRHA